MSAIEALLAQGGAAADRAAAAATAGAAGALAVSDALRAANARVRAAADVGGDLTDLSPAIVALELAIAGSAVILPPPPPAAPEPQSPPAFELSLAAGIAPSEGAVHGAMALSHGAAAVSPPAAGAAAPAAAPTFDGEFAFRTPASASEARGPPITPDGTLSYLTQACELD